MILHHVEYPSRGEDTGVPVVFLGSIASTTNMWLPQLDALSANHRVIALDHPGHGRSGKPDLPAGEATVSDLADNVLKTLTHLGVQEFAVVGLSMGGAIAQYLAATSSRVTRAAFLCTATSFGGREKWAERAQLTRSKGTEAMADNVVSLWLSEEYARTHPATRDWYRAMICRTSGEGYAHGADALGCWDFASRLHRITCPVLTLAGADDKSTPPEVVHAIAEKVSGPASTATVPGGHVPTLESADAVNEALAEFLK